MNWLLWGVPVALVLIVVVVRLVRSFIEADIEAQHEAEQEHFHRRRGDTKWPRE